MATPLNKEFEDAIKKHINSFADQEPPFTSLGTPFLVDTAATEAVVQMGKPAVPALVKALNSQSQKIVMYAAYCLGLIGDPSVLQELQRVREKHESHEPKTENDFGIISAIRQAEDKLSTGLG